MHPFSRFSRKVIKPVSQLGHQRYGDGWQWETGKVILWTIMHTYINHSFLLPTFVYTIKISASHSYMAHEVHSSIALLFLPRSYTKSSRQFVNTLYQPSQLLELTISFNLCIFLPQYQGFLFVTFTQFSFLFLFSSSLFTINNYVKPLSNSRNTTGLILPHWGIFRDRSWRSY